jgi:hypothetical protein
MANNIKRACGESKLVPHLWHNLHWLKANKLGQTVT